MTGFTTPGPRLWPVSPDWTNGVQETLTWATEVQMASATAVTVHRGHYAAPLRSLAFEILVASQEHRVTNMLLAGYGGTWFLPFWPDVQWLSGPVAAIDEFIPCATAGFDFVAGGYAALYDSVNRWNLVQVASIEADHIALSAPVGAAYGPGARVVPVRRARAQPGAEERLRNLDTGRRTLAFDMVDPVDWPALVDPAQYQGHLVLDVRPDESEDPSSSYERMLETVDYGTAAPFVHDLPDFAMRQQASQWKLFGRAQHSWFRSLLYSLDGRRVPIWIPSFSADLQPVSPIAGGSVLVGIEWAGYAQFGLDRHNRKDVRIELADGSVHYRRILDAAQAGAGEILELDAPIDDSAIVPEAVRSVSLMALSTLASDKVEIEHITDQDGAARASTGWRAVVPDV